MSDNGSSSSRRPEKHLIHLHCTPKSSVVVYCVACLEVITVDMTGLLHAVSLTRCVRVMNMYIRVHLLPFAALWNFLGSCCSLNIIALPTIS